MRILDMDISARAKSCLLRAGYTDSNEIRQLSDEDLLSIKNLNQNCVDEIRDALNKNEKESDQRIIENDNEESLDNNTSNESDLETFGTRLFEVLGTLTEREQKAISLRFGLEDGQARTLEQVSGYFHLTRERIRQILVIAIRKLRHPRRFRELIPYVEGDLDIVDILKQYADRTLVVRIPKEDDGGQASVNNSGFSSENDIARLELPIRAYNCLTRAGVNTIDALCNMTVDDLLNVRNLGRKSTQDVIDKLEERGLSIKKIEKNDSEQKLLSDSDFGDNNGINLDSIYNYINRINVSLFGKPSDERTFEFPASQYELLQTPVNEIFKDTSIEGRVLKFCKEDNISILRELCAYSEGSIRHFGDADEKCLSQILNRYSLSLRPYNFDKYVYIYPLSVKKYYYDKPDSWEYRLFNEAWIAYYEWLSIYKAQKIQLWVKNISEVDRSHIIHTRDELIKYTTNKLDEIMEYVKKTSEAMEKTNAGFGEPGVEGDAVKIMESVQDFMNAYKKIIEWRLELNGIYAPKRYRRVIEELLNFGNDVIADIDNLYSKHLKARKQFDEVENGNVTEENLHIDFSIKYSTKTARLDEAIENLKYDKGYEENYECGNDTNAFGFKDVSLDELELSPREYSTLKRAGYNTVKELFEKVTEDEVRLGGHNRLEEGYRNNLIQRVKERYASLYNKIAGRTIVSDEEQRKLPGHEKCEKLREIRRKIAEANDIKFEPVKCDHNGPCFGTCPVCDEEIKYLDEQLQKKKKQGEDIVLNGLAANEVRESGCNLESDYEIEYTMGMRTLPDIPDFDCDGDIW